MPLFKASDARMQGIPSRMLSYFCQIGTIERIERGVYRVFSAESEITIDLEELVLTATSIPHGVICLISALFYYGLTDQIMREYWIAVPNCDRSPKRLHTRIVRMRNMTLGQTTVRIGKYRVKIFNRERTVIDAFRLLSHEIAIKALQRYLKTSENNKPDIPKLVQYAKILGVQISSYILALTT
jgi:predicted transcriptional regulator of viral defense system